MKPKSTSAKVTLANLMPLALTEATILLQGFSGIFGDFRGFSGIFGDFQGFSGIFGDFRGFSGIFGEITFCQHFSLSRVISVQ